MRKIRQFAALQLRKITGGKDPVALVESFIDSIGLLSDECKLDSEGDSAHYLLPVTESEQVEILVEGIDKHDETTVYMSTDIAIVPIRRAYDYLAAALELADGLVGIKISLVGHRLVMSATLGAAGLTAEEIEYHYRLIDTQKHWFRESMIELLDPESGAE